MTSGVSRISDVLTECRARHPRWLPDLPDFCSDKDLELILAMGIWGRHGIIWVFRGGSALSGRVQPAGMT